MKRINNTIMRCIICKEREATIKDRREAPWGKKKKLCAECHTIQLEKDLENVYSIYYNKLKHR